MIIWGVMYTFIWDKKNNQSPILCFMLLEIYIWHKVICFRWNFSQSYVWTQYIWIITRNSCLTIELLNNCPDSLKLILGDFNHCSLNDALPNYHQVVNCNTRGDKTIDLCYSNIGNSYTSKCKPALGNSDHNMIHLIPTYRQKLKIDKPHTLEVQDWSENNIDLLRGCFECTDFNVLMSQNPTIDEQVICISDYIKFCSDTIIPTKQVKIYPNNKPWITKDLKSLLNKKKAILATKDKHKLREVQTAIKSAIYQAKLKHKQKMENMFNSNDTRQAWSYLKNNCWNQKEIYILRTWK